MALWASCLSTKYEQIVKLEQLLSQKVGGTNPLNPLVVQLLKVGGGGEGEGALAPPIPFSYALDTSYMTDILQG